jgi:BTB/POZ domain
MEPGQFPKARTGNQGMRGGFGFAGPSDAWLKANGLLKNTFTGGSQALSESEEISLQEGKRKALERFERPQEEIKLIPEPIPSPIVLTPEQISIREEIAKKREAALILNQMELDMVTPPSIESPKRAPADPEKREKCLSWINFKPMHIEIPEIQINFNLEKFIDSSSSDFFISSDDGTRIGVHKVVLYARSAIFQAMFSNNSAETVDGEYHINQFSGNAIRLMVKYLYSGQVKVSNNDIIELLYLADYFKLDTLKYAIEYQLENFIDFDNLIDLWEISHENKLEGLKRKCWSFCASNPDVKKLSSRMPQEMKSYYYKNIYKR